MKEQELFDAIGGVELRFLEELEQPQVRRLPRHFGLVAAVIALLLTACAAPAVIRSLNAVKGGTIVSGEADVNVVERILSQREDVMYIAMPSGDTMYTSGRVEVEVEPAEDAPETIQTHYLPLKLLEYCEVEAYEELSSGFSLELSITAPRLGKISDVVFRQCTLEEDGKMVVEGILDGGMWETRTLELGEISALEIYGQDLLHTESASAPVFIRHFFWSDGEYLYCLKIPVVYPLNSEKVEQILASLTEVEEISDYLPAAE